MQITKNFASEEFTASKTAQQLGIINQITTTEQRDALWALVREVLQPLRTAWGAPLKINSGFRCPALNKAVGGAATSQHTKGEAADVACAEPVKLARLAIALGLPFDQLILYPTFCHISHKREGEQRGQLLYNKSYKGERV